MGILLMKKNYFIQMAVKDLNFASMRQLQEKMEDMCTEFPELATNSDTDIPAANSAVLLSSEDIEPKLNIFKNSTVK